MDIENGDRARTIHATQADSSHVFDDQTSKDQENSKLTDVKLP